MNEEREILRPFTVHLEEDQLQALDEIAREMQAALPGQRWSLGAVIRIAVSQFLAQRGKIA